MRKCMPLGITVFFRVLLSYLLHSDFLPYLKIVEFFLPLILSVEKVVTLLYFYPIT